jgi:hypothetical protein
MFKRFKTASHLVFLLGHFLHGVKISNVLSFFYQYRHELGGTLDGTFKPLRSPGIDSASLCSLSGRYDNPIRFLAPIDCYKIPALKNIAQSSLY